MKKIIIVVVGIIFIALIGRAIWAYQAVKNDEAKVIDTPVVTLPVVPSPIQATTSSATLPIVLSAVDIKAKEDLIKTISELTELIKQKCGIGSKDTQCDTAKNIVDALTQKCLPLSKNDEISSCIFSYGAGAIFTPLKSATSSIPSAGVVSNLLPTTSFTVNGLTSVNVKVGDIVKVSWTSKNADEISKKEMSFTGCLDPKQNTSLSLHNLKDMADVNESMPITIDLSGCLILIKITVANTKTLKQATAEVTIKVN